MRVAVIGGGPSGLVTLKYLTKAHLSLNCDPIEAQLFESEDNIGGAFLHRAYEDAEVSIPVMSLKTQGLTKNDCWAIARVFETTDNVFRFPMAQRSRLL
jgi:cation diffusion facilitator CzcD-associated flavoprotein CzcO